MADIRVIPAGMRQCVDEINEILRRLGDLGEDVECIQSRLVDVMSGSGNIAASLRSLSGVLQAESGAMGRLSKALETAAAKYETTEREIAGEGGETVARLSEAQDKKTKTFSDGKNDYGADQGDMMNSKRGMWFFGYRWFEDEDLYDFIRQRHPNWSQDQIAALMKQINAEGCGYVAIVNNIYVEYEGHEAEFEATFGFPMYDEKGNPNYNYLLLDFFMETDDKYYLNDPMGATALVNDTILRYEKMENGEAAFIQRYGCKPTLGDGRINPEARQKIIDEHEGIKTVISAEDGTTNYSLENRFRHYMNARGVSYSIESGNTRAPMSTKQINSYLDSGKNVNIAAGKFNLYNKDGSVAAKDVGDHWMTVTGTTKDGRYIVSSWGKRYYLNPSEIQNVQYVITDIKPR